MFAGRWCNTENPTDGERSPTGSLGKALNISCYGKGMSNANRRPWKNIVNGLARQVPPTREPFFPAVFGAMIISIAWMALPRVITAVLANAFWGRVLARTGCRLALVILFHLIQTVGTALAVFLWARCVELFWPGYFDPFRDRHH